jgi:DNA-binding NarL/FixJ family response regulator
MPTPTQDILPAPDTDITIAILEPRELRLRGYEEALLTEPVFRIFSGTPAQAIEDRSVHVLLLGSQTAPGLFERIQEIRRQRPDLRILVAGTHGDDETIVRCIQAGAKGYIDEACSIPEFLQAVHIVSQGSIWAPRRLLSKFIDRVLDAPPGTKLAAKPAFSPREREVLTLLVAGFSNREIARNMGIEERTVKAHVAKLLRKVGVANRTALTMHTINHALLNLP